MCLSTTYISRQLADDMGIMYVLWIHFNASIDNILVIVINFMYFLDLLPTHYFEETFQLWPKMKDFTCANTCCNIDNDTVMFKTIISLNLIVRTSQIIKFNTTRFFGISIEIK